MKNLRFIIMSLIFMGSYTTSRSQVQQTCGTDDAVNLRASSTVDFAKFRADLNKKIYEHQTIQAKKPDAAGQAGKLLPSPFIMPTVVHIVHNGEAIGTGSNLSDATVISAIADLNSRLSNANGNGVDMNVQLCLAVRDPNNNPTNGITRYNASGHAGFSAAGVNYSAGCGGADPTPIFAANDWPNQSYFNIYIFKDICGTTAWTDYYGCYFKTISYSPSLNGPLQAHEAGHYLGLAHTFNGDGGNVNCPVNNDCAVDGDGVCDTPPVKSGDCASSACPLPPGGILTNSTYNYLGYCFGQWDRYTQGQKDRVTAAQNFPPLNLLPVSLGCVPLSANDAGIQAIINPVNTTYTTLCGGDPYSTAPVVQLRNYGTSALTNVNIKYKLDNGAVSNYAWSGNLASYTTTNVTLPGISIPQGAHTFTAYTTLPNGVTDPYNPNDTTDVSVNITGPSAVTATGSQTSTTCAGNDGTATVNPSGGTLQNVYNSLTDWEGPHGWTIVNGAQPNQWCVGTAVDNGGSYSIYMSDATSGCSNNNTTGAQYATVHFYKDFSFPANASNIQIGFDWRNLGWNDSSDYIETYLVGTGTTPAAGTVLGTGKIGVRYWNNQNFTTATLGNLDAHVGTTKRLVFTWSNDWYMVNPAGAVDNINVSYTQTFNYTYSWNTVPVQTTQTATGLAAGTYTCTITDGQGCTKTQSVTVLNGCGGGVSITANGPTTFCSGGSVQLTSSLPSGNSWSTGATTQSITVTASGSYNCTNNGNTSNTIVVTVNSLPASAISTSGPATFCSGGSVSLCNSGEPGNALNLDGVNDYANLGNPAALQLTGNLTVEAWIKAATWKPNSWQGSLINKEDWTTFSYGYSLRCGNNGQLSFNLGSNPGSWTEIQSSSGAMVTGQWYHVAATYDGTTMKLYLNGNLVASNPKTGSIGNSTTSLYLGNCQLDLARGFDGKMDEVRIWNVARTQSQIQSNKNKTVSTTSSGLVGYYMLDEGTGTKLVNKKTNTYAGDLANGPTWLVPSNAPIGSVKSAYQWSTGATTRNILVTTGGTYYLTVTNNNGCTKVSSGKTVTVNALPSASVTASGALTFCAGGSVTFTASSGNGYTYQWLKNGNNISGATNISYTATTAGTYKVVVTKTNGCSKTSNGKVVTINCKTGEEYSNSLNMGVYPNPTQNHLTVTFESEYAYSLLKVLDVTGKVISQLELKGEEGGFEDELDVSFLSPGVYMLQVTSGDRQSNIRFIKQ